MALLSNLFAGDAALNAAASSDPAHIKPGDHGPHVHKIQTALILLDDAKIAYGEAQNWAYGPSTAAATLAYKRKRDIVNRSYQTQADNIVGRMTMARLDREMCDWEARPHPPVRIWSAAFQRVRPPRSMALMEAISGPRALSASKAKGAGAVTAPPSIGPVRVMVLPPNGSGTFVVSDGEGGTVRNFDPDLIKVEVADFLEWVPSERNRAPVTSNPQTFRVTALNKFGEAMVDVSAPGGLADLTVVITKRFPAPPVFHPAPPHNHAPCGKWAEIKADPQSEGLVAVLCAGASDPQQVMDGAKSGMAKFPLAVEHLDWYLTKGNGADFVEDQNIRHWIEQDANIRARLKREIFPSPGKKRVTGNFTFSRDDFDRRRTENFALSFGAIDRIDYSVDFSDDTVRVWFQDRYEFHPFYPRLYNAESGDMARGDNCVHAAAVEMKSRGAKDYWMKGEAVVPLSLIVGP